MSPPGGQDTAGQALERLMALVTRLRAPDGCPWDRKQTFRSVAPYILEEAFEAVEAVESGEAGEALGELGDVLFQVVFMARLYEEAGAFTLAQVIDRVVEKMTGRHPHVFGDRKAESAEEVKGLWGELKKAERAGNGQGLLDSVPKASPALVRARRLGQRAARVGFDWPGPEAVWQKAGEERAELAAAPNQEREAQELGDLLFTWAQWARHRGLDPEACLRRANTRFAHRFGRMEALAGQRGLSLEDLDLAALDELWEQAKAAEGAHPDATGS